MKKQNKKKIPMILWGCLYVLFIIFSIVFDNDTGKQIGSNFMLFVIDTLKLFPPAFILIGLFMVWVNRETVEKYLGVTSGLLGYLSAIALACTTLYPFIVVLPMAAALFKKGARLSIVLTYLGASAICRIPMTIFEASYLGLKFTIIRYIVSLPLIILSSIIIEKIVRKENLSTIDEAI